MTDLASVLMAFRAASGCEASVWTQAAGGALTWEATTNRAPPPTNLPAVSDGLVPLDAPDGPAFIAAIPGPRRAWLVIGPTQSPATDLRKQFDFLLPVVAHVLQSALEVEHAANELAERYEEINLLYTISEILGRTVALEEATARILTEISETVGARKAAVLVHDPIAKSLVAVAVLGAPAQSVGPIPVDDEASVSARVFRTCHPLIIEPEQMLWDGESAIRRGAMLSVPIMWTSPRGGAEPLGVVDLSDRRSGHGFTAGDQKLISAIATQIGTAIQNARLVRESLSQQRLRQEMQHAHDLQMRLLPTIDAVAPTATVAARVVPAESVGGDFYNLFRLGPGKTGVMIGDVSGHGYQAALIMALAMSASAIHAQTTADAGETLSALLSSMRDELATTEMYISLFYAVVDRNAGRLRYANAGHPHAFVIPKSGKVERLPALDPPLGMGNGAPTGASRPWTTGDLLLLFTDGVSDARDRDGERLGEEKVVEVARKFREEPPAKLLDRIFALLDQHTGDTPRRDDLTIVALRS
ncbi:MAG TPA: GAF domain-containing SpoIIE family protein phosphatase [Gemmatimonadaceae bacterium]|nr:GAF domain-containing SpoIIE family protein phosphatase [Gemmatimonadaceae bacterium]